MMEKLLSLACGDSTTHQKTTAILLFSMLDGECEVEVVVGVCGFFISILQLNPSTPADVLFRPCPSALVMDCGGVVMEDFGAANGAAYDGDSCLTGEMSVNMVVNLSRAFQRVC